MSGVDFGTYFDVDRFSHLFPQSVGARSITLNKPILPLFPEEERLIARASRARQIEFAAGRHCARESMAQLGWPRLPISSGVDRAPVWPAGLTGSITHSAGACAAVVANKKNFEAVGIDIELAGSVSAELADLILAPDEIVALHKNNKDKFSNIISLYFSLKEASYKAFYQKYKIFIEFHEMRVHVDVGAGRYEAFVYLPEKLIFSKISGRFYLDQYWIYAASWILADECKM